MPVWLYIYVAATNRRWACTPVGEGRGLRGGGALFLEGPTMACYGRADTVQCLLKSGALNSDGCLCCSTVPDLQI